MQWILQLPKEIAVLFVATLPIFELRGAIPLGFFLGLPIGKIFILSFIGNLLPVIPIYFLLHPIFEKLKDITIFNKFFTWLFRHTKKRSAIIERYEALGLMVFVAIPLPITGVWTGTVAATLFKIRFRTTFLALVLGVIIASIIVSTLCVIGRLSWQMMI